MIDIISEIPFHMDSKNLSDFNIMRKRKSGPFPGEPSSKRLAQEIVKPESTPKKILRRISTRFRNIGSNIIGKNNKCTGNNSVIDEE